MLITLSDGVETYLYDTVNRSLAGTAFLRNHCLRFHVFDPETKLAVEKFSTGDRQLQDDILRAARLHGPGAIDMRNTWIRPRLTRQELWPLHNEARMVYRDLRRYWGDDLKMRGTSRRYIYYLSDGSMKNTPDAIGKMGNHPLIYEGYAMATIFDIKELDPLQSDYNIVHWLTKPMWESFHNRKRGVHKDFPWPTGFLATKWCQRDGYSRYRTHGISLASMTQGQTVGTWSITQLPQFWRERMGKNIFRWKTEQYKPTAIKRTPDSSAQISHYVAAQSGCEYGLVGISCVVCGKYLQSNKRYCPACGTTNTSGYMISASHFYCTACGKAKNLCECGENAAMIKIGTQDLNKQIKCIEAKRQEV